MEDDEIIYAEESREDRPEGSAEERRRPEVQEESTGALKRWLRREAGPLAVRVLVQLALWWITRDPRHFPGGQ